MSRHLSIERTKLLELIKFNKNITSANGLYLYSEDGDKYLDFTTQFGAVPFGHNPDFLWKKLIEEKEKSPGIMIQPFHSEGAIRLSRKLIEVAPKGLEYVTFGCTGAEVVEIAIKMAKAKTKREAILSTRNSFHGKTMAAVLATGNEYYRECFYPVHESFSHVEYDDSEALEQALASKQYAAFIVEPVQGEGGMITPTPGYLKSCEQLCKKYGTLFIVDEVQTGLGRTGKLFACEHEQVEPDILLLSKTLSGGMIPISACLANKKAWSKDFGQRHSSTFANNHLATVVGYEVINKLVQDHSILANVQKTGRYLAEQLSALVEKYPQAFTSNHGIGLMQGLVLQDWDDEESYACQSLTDHGFIVALVSGYLLNRHNLFTMFALNNKNLLRIQPCYYVTEKEIDLLIHALEDVGELITHNRYSEILRVAIDLEPEPSHVSSHTYKDNHAVASGPKLGTFCFLVHPLNEISSVDCMPGGQNAYNQEETAKILDWMDKAKSQYNEAASAYYMPCIPSNNGGYVDGWLLFSMLTPSEMMSLSKAEKERLIASYVELAQEKEASVIGLGAFTSVITRSGTAVENCGTPVTTGNAFTALTSTDSIRQISQKKSIHLDQLTLGVVGASGSVGRLCLLDIGAEFQKIMLIGNARNGANVKKLEVVAGELLFKLFENPIVNLVSPVFQKLTSINTKEIINSQPIDQNSQHYPENAYRELFVAVRDHYLDVYGQLDDFPILLSNHVEETLPKCDVVITATSNGEAFIQPGLLAKNAIVCDVARPSDLLQEVIQSRSDITAYEGGLVRMPADLRFGRLNIVNLDSGVTLACLAETVVLTMSQADKNYSLGGISSIEEAREVFQMALSHGFRTHIDMKQITSLETDDQVMLAD
ncbi:aminotransferase class III-fold pyridoxal phosphate-dependent enzyme [Vibrio mangrovi]|uniref:Aminotransferase class III-fold pyridoxal phosphate-dependent enzyme n=1 Tax=Vibrio mangrovi TaxID=474394 RepID=A0A1Y6IMX4_9VIBR|nr:aminotransferase class III-fold pyridoxal phosphate-dependent enzyme [Vibrio mangrovi]MDW6004189.1 aminotransferase class III-fold pyridoxal phosphate-dependent enzyme [Vibrio mangrovi]SMR99014.1 Putrescine aminotransferase [Vibrio mangrovi]